MTSPVIGSHSLRCTTPWRANTRDTVRAGTPSSAPIASGPSRCAARNATIAFSTEADVRVGIDRGREERSSSPTRPPVSNRSIHLCTHWREIPMAAAICDLFQPSRNRSTISNLPW
jgi:hypothetical protein